MPGQGGISGTGVAVATAGGVLLYSALTGQTPVAALKSVLSGHPTAVPNQGATFPDAAANNYAAGATTGSYGGRIVADARKYIGVPYRWGGASPSTGFDCSGLVTWVLHHDLGLNLPSNTHTVTTQFLVWSGATTVPVSTIQPGDLICWGGHIAIASDPGKMIEAPGVGKPVRETTIRTLGASIRRVKDQTRSFTDVPNTRSGGAF